MGVGRSIRYANRRCINVSSVLIPPPLLMSVIAESAKGENAFCLCPRPVTAVGKPPLRYAIPASSSSVSSSAGKSEHCPHPSALSEIKPRNGGWPLQFLPHFESMELSAFFLDAFDITLRYYKPIDSYSFGCQCTFFVRRRMRRMRLTKF